jgi:hypothetical protein
MGSWLNFTAFSTFIGFGVNENSFCCMVDAHKFEMVYLFRSLNTVPSKKKNRVLGYK